MLVSGPRGKPSAFVVLLSETFKAGAVSKAQRSLGFVCAVTDGPHGRLLCCPCKG